MPSSRDRRRLEVPAYIHEKLQQIAARESRTVASVVNELLNSALGGYRSSWIPNEHLQLLNDRAKRVLTHAEEEARSFGHNYLGTEHLLLGLLREEQGAAVTYLNGRGVDLDKVREQVVRLIGRGTAPPATELELVPRARRVLALAVDEARRHGHLRVGTEHILLGLALEGHGVGAGILDRLGVDLEQLRQRRLTGLSQMD
jgi:ATP-dependent Clp protease ATP-binding subunit ClpC